MAEIQATSADCGCTMILKRAADGGIYSNGLNVKPGDKVCIEAGTYKYINLFNYNGTAQAPIQIINCGGQVVVNGSNYAFVITKSRYFTFTGTGTPGVFYGFSSTGGSVYSATGMGINSATDFSIDHVEIQKTKVGIICKTNPTCDASTWEQAFTARNIVFRDLYIHDVEGEGLYIGHTSTVVSLTCSGKVIDVLPQRIRGLKIYNCRVESTGWDGIQVASTPEDAQIYNNTVNNFGTRNQSSQQAGILLGGLSNGKVYNNYVANGTGNGIQVLGVGHIQVNNNVVVNVGGNNVVSNSKDGIFIDERPFAGYPSLYVTACNNTVVSPKRSSIRMENTYKTITTMSQFHNNLMVASGEPNASFTGVVVRNNAPNNSTGNLYLQAVSQARFVGTNDYHLNSSSPAVDAGVPVSTWGIVTDKDGLNRSMGAKPDAGAYEYPGTSIPAANQAPVANAGTDKAITLPVNRVTLTGTASDPDGSITKYAWTKVAGPTQITIANASTLNPQISSLVTGNYTLRLTVTDNKNLTAYDDILVVVNPQGATAPPSAPGAQSIPGKIQAESFVAMSGIQTEPTKDVGGGSNISWVHKNDWMEYRVNVASPGVYGIQLRVASKVNAGQIQIRNGSGNVLATINVPNTGGYQTWSTISTSVTLQSGVQTLRIYSSSTGAWFLNWLEFSYGSTTSTRSLSDSQPTEAFETSTASEVFPNPVLSNFTLYLDNDHFGPMNIKIVDLTGRVRKQFKSIKNHRANWSYLNVNGLGAGTYFVQVHIADWTNSWKLIKL